MLTADTITDKQIRELRDALVRDGFLFDASVEERAQLTVCDDALYAPTALRARARARCAEILNTRTFARVCQDCLTSPGEPHDPLCVEVDECSTCGAIHDDVDCFGEPVARAKEAK